MAVSTYTGIYMWLLLTCVTAILSMNVGFDDNRPKENNDIVAVLVNEVRDLKAVVEAQEKEVLTLKAVTEAQAEEIQALKSEVMAQRGEIRDLKLGIEKQRETNQAFRKMRHEKSDRITVLESRLQEGNTVDRSVTSAKGHHHGSENKNASTQSPAREKDHDRVVIAGEPTDTREADFSKRRTLPAVKDHDKTLKLNSERRARLSRGTRVASQGVAFSSYLSRDLTDLGLGQTVKLDMVLLNDGNAYNTHTGIFTAPVTGVFMFTYFIHDNLKYEGAVIELVVDDINEVDAFIYPTDGHNVMGGNSAVLRVRAGQSVWLQTTHWNNAALRSHGDQHFVTFSGFLLYS